ncbi:MAG TPA: bifunctional [glutamate--ammonia ligase]-adenylyl-L-tyrosine phosphorylase/[glutamate--ammonia-ligase] adenylyltransferase, partial [Pseudoxanthomonas sp.]|nr:bifunctional [glutamate--ammonia ligase]-adenylyl-L-tyrosine phosphorylase/[glutamate--ammonia-ligase] adenylyltransferase [Pseudoxanthomonas sp.]
LQLVHGGRDASLRERRLLPALRALAQAGNMPRDNADALIEAYLYLRRLENRLQMLRDAQTHALPDDPLDRLRVARGLGLPDWEALLAALDAQRAKVSAEFNELLAPRPRTAQHGTMARYWRALPGAGDVELLASAGFAAPAQVDAALREFARSSGVASLSDAARARLDRVLPALLEATSHSSQPDAALKRALSLLQAVLRRASYLALLDEQPNALARLVDVVARSALLAERLAAFPLLLDELLDARVGGPLPERAQMRAACTAALAEADPEVALRVLNERRLALSFRTALAALDQRQPARESARQLAWLADEVVRVALAMVERDLVAAHGRVPGGRFAVIGYGSLGGEELGFGSDLDLVFLYDARDAEGSDGARPLEPSRWYARLAQKLVALLGAVSAAGRLYQVDVRLRPDGAKGLLVSSLASYRDYQRERAWTWEHQALVRARGVAGDESLRRDFEGIRRQTLTAARDAGTLRDDVIAMRRRMRAELDRSNAARFDLKQGEGGLVDLEFLLQYLVLRESAAHPALLQPRDTCGLIAAMAQAGRLPAGDADALEATHGTFVALGLACTLDRRPRLLAEDATLAAARTLVMRAAEAQGLDFA